MSLFLFMLCTAIWGSTWIAITFQLGQVPVEVSVFYRFASAALVLFGICAAKKFSLKLSRQNHLFVALQGFCLFSINYILTYYAESNVSSGIVALTFSLIMFLNILGGRVFFGRTLSSNVLISAFMGICGLSLIFYKEILGFQSSSQNTGAIGIVIGLAATVFASTGNLLFTRNKAAGVSVMAANTWGMFYGSMLTLATALVFGRRFEIPLTASYLGSLAYLSLFGSVIAFVSYLTLISRIGAERASYSAITIPAVALVISSFYENFHWSPLSIAGVVLCLAGNALALRPVRTKDYSASSSISSSHSMSVSSCGAGPEPLASVFCPKE